MMCGDSSPQRRCDSTYAQTDPTIRPTYAGAPDDIGAPYPFHFTDGHLFLDLDGQRYLLDTGAGVSLSEQARELTLAGRRFPLQRQFLGMTAEGISALAGTPFTGLIGNDILGQFDWFFDEGTQLATATEQELWPSGRVIPLVMGLAPLIDAPVDGQPVRWIFDTGAQISFLERDALRESFPSAGAFQDFFPPIGKFTTETRWVDVELGWGVETLRCGKLPEPLAGLVGRVADGIIGNSLFSGRFVGYFPRRAMLVLGARHDRSGS